MEESSAAFTLIFDETWDGVQVEELLATGKYRGSRSAIRYFLTFCLSLTTALVLNGLIRFGEGGRIRRATRTAVFALTALLALTPLLRVDAWQKGHDGFHFHERAQIYEEQLYNFDWIPAWSMSSSMGYGSPLPVMYHKLHTAVAAVFLIVTSDGYTAHFLTLWSFLCVGIVGVYAFARQLGSSPLIAATLAAIYPFLNYPFAQWLIRAAMAEFAAAQILPWALLWCIRTINGKAPHKLFLSGVCIFISLYLAHAVIFFYFSFPVALAIGTRLLFSSDRFRFALYISALTAAIAGIVGPIALVQQRLSAAFQFRASMLLHEPQGWLQAWRRYFLLIPEKWPDFQGYYRFDLFLWSGFFSLCALSIAIAVRHGIKDNTKNGKNLAFLLTMLVFYLVLMFPIAAPFYDSAEVFRYLQFPFRLHSFVLIFLLAAAALICATQIPRRFSIARSAILTATLVGTLWASPAFVLPTGISDGSQALRLPLSPGRPLFVGATFEYFPNIEGTAPGYETYKQLLSYHPSPVLSKWTASAYAIEQVGRRSAEQRELHYSIHFHEGSDRKEEVTLPINWSGYETIAIMTPDGWKNIRTYRLPGDPRVRFMSPTSTRLIRYQAPTFMKTLLNSASS